MKTDSILPFNLAGTVGSRVRRFRPLARQGQKPLLERLETLQHLGQADQPLIAQATHGQVNLLVTDVR